MKVAEAVKQHLGTLVRLLREAAGLTRMQFEEQVDLSMAAIKGIELGYHRPTRAQLDRLLQHQAMAELMAMAERRGISVDLAPGPNSEGGGGAGPEGGDR